MPRILRRRVRVGGRHRPGQVLRQRAAGQAHVQGAPHSPRRDHRVLDSQVPQGGVRHGIGPRADGGRNPARGAAFALAIEHLPRRARQGTRGEGAQVLQVRRRRRHPSPKPHGREEGDGLDSIFHRTQDEAQGQRGEDEGRPSQRPHLPWLFLLQKPRRREVEGARLEREARLPQSQGARAHQKERPDPDQGDLQARQPTARGLDKLLPARGHEGADAGTLAMDQGQDKGNHLQEVEEAEEEEGGASEVPRPEGKERGFERMVRMENPAKSEGRGGPWRLRRPLREGGEERETGLLPDRLDTRNGPFAQPRGLLPRAEEVALLIGTAVCGKPHVRWCERADELDNHRSTRLIGVLLGFLAKVHRSLWSLAEKNDACVCHFKDNSLQ